MYVFCVFEKAIFNYIGRVIESKIKSEEGVEVGKQYYGTNDILNNELSNK